MEKRNAPLVSVLVLNYNGKRFLDDCFQSVLSATYPNCEVVMIDNKSTDDSVAYMKKNYPQVKIFQTGADAGFSRAYNMGFEIAQGKYFVLLNNDVKVAPDWLEPLVAEAESYPEVGALQPKLLSLRKPDEFEYAGASGGYIDVYGYPFSRGRLFQTVEKDNGQYDDVVQVFWTTGAAMFVRADILSKSGGLDKDFVHHMEEIDMCYRINLVGYILKVVPASIVYHYGGGTIKYESYSKLYWNHRNSIFMMLKNLERKNLFRFIFARFALDAITLFRSLVSLNFKQFAAIFHAYFWLLFHPGMVSRKRKQVQKDRVIADKELAHLVYSKSIALQYYIRKRKTYRELMENSK
jgi:hypothetical protein